MLFWQHRFQFQEEEARRDACMGLAEWTFRGIPLGAHTTLRLITAAFTVKADNIGGPNMIHFALRTFD